MKDLFKRNILEKCSDYFDAKIREKVGPPSKEHRNGATAEEWVAYEKRSKEECPELHKWKKFFDDLDIFFSVRYRMYVTDPIYYVKQRFIRRNHILDLSPDIPKGSYTDIDHKVTAANFILVSDFILNEKDGKPWEIVEYEKNQRGEASQMDGEYGLSMAQIQPMIDIYEAYMWWIRRQEREDTINLLYAEMRDDDDDEDFCVMTRLTREHMDKYKDVHDRIQELETQYLEEETLHLNNIIKHRKCLWT